LPQLGALSGDEGGWKYVERAKMNEKVYVKISHRQRFMKNFSSSGQCMCGGKTLAGPTEGA